VLALIGTGCQRGADNSNANGAGRPRLNVPAVTVAAVAVNSPPVYGSTPAGEDPEVVEYVKKKGWRLYNDQLASNGESIVSLEFHRTDKTSLTADDCKMIARSKTAQWVNLRNTDVTDDGLKVIAGAPELKVVALEGSIVTDAGMKALAGCKKLESVNLYLTDKVTDAGVKELAALPKLRSLFFYGLKLNGTGLAAFAGSKTLESVDLGVEGNLTDEGVKTLAELPNLKNLSLGHGYGTDAVKAIVAKRLPAKFVFNPSVIDDELFETLVAKGWLYNPKPRGQFEEPLPASPGEVADLWLDGTRITDKGFRAVLDCTNAKSVHAGGTGITDETLKKLSAFTQLRYLTLNKTKVTAAGLQALAGLPLDHLALEGCELSEDELKVIGKMSGLKELELAETKPDPAWLKHLSGLRELNDLNLRSARFNDAAVKYVTTLPKLEKLALHRTDLTDVGFQELVKLPTLKELWVDDTKVTKEVFRKAKKEHPKLSLTFYGYD
jgi:Leucine-rich repeat (LRR) protein